MAPPLRFTLRQLQYFTSAARTGQISLAADECHVSQSTVTSAIAELERSLDVLLFDRARSGVTLTYNGHLFLQRAKRVLESADDAARHPFRTHSELRGSFELAASYTVLGYFLLPFVARFKKQHPEARITLLEQDRARMEEAVGSGETELAVTLISNLVEPRRFRSVALTRSRRQLWVAEASPLAEMRQVSLADVARYPYIIPMVDEGEVSALGYWRDAGLQPASFIRTSSMEAVREMVSLDLGTTILSDLVFRPWSLEGRPIKAVPLSHPMPTMEVGLIWLKDRRLSPLAEAFRKYLQLAVGLRADD